MSQTPVDPVEQLSAFMDGELPDAEARFLLRRLEHDAGLREAWSRMQLASQCLRAQPWQPMDASLAARVAAGIAATEPSSAGHRPWLRWAAAASVLALGLVMAPRMLQSPPAPAASVADASPSAAPAANLVASPASADLVAMRQPAPTAAPAVPEAADADGREDTSLVAAVAPSDQASPLPLGSADSESPADFPLVDNGEERSWPRSELVSASSDPAIEAYLVRHNQMIAADGLGGFVPYVDVVSNGQPAASADTTAAPESDGK